MSLKKLLYTQLCEYLLQKLQFEDGVPSLVTIDKDFGQFELMKDGVITIPLPAIMISFPNTNFESNLGGEQTGEGLIKVRIGMENFYDSNNFSPNQQLALNFFDFNERTHNAITSYKQNYIGGIQRVNEAEDDNHDSVIITEIIYKYTLYGEGENGDTKTVQGNITTRFVKDLEQTPPTPELDIDWVLP